MHIPSREMKRQMRATPLQRRRWQNASAVMESRLRRERPASKSSHFLLQSRLEGPGQQQVFSEEGAVMGGSKKAGGISTAAWEESWRASTGETRGWCGKSKKQGKGILIQLHLHRLHQPWEDNSTSSTLRQQPFQVCL